jgi:hypothetical protein
MHPIPNSRTSYIESLVQSNLLSDEITSAKLQMQNLQVPRRDKA